VRATASCGHGLTLILLLLLLLLLLLGWAVGCALQELGISNTQYSLLQAAVSLVNTIVPLFGGQFVDVFGTGWGSIVASTLILVGDLIVAFSTEVASYPVMVVGRLIYGCVRCGALVRRT
jgi:MFS family permease